MLYLWHNPLYVGTQYITNTASPLFFKKLRIYVLKKITIVFRAKGNLSAPHHLTCSLDIETWKHSPIVLIPFFHAGKDILYVPTKIQIVHLAAFI